MTNVLLEMFMEALEYFYRFFLFRNMTLTHLCHYYERRSKNMIEILRIPPLPENTPDITNALEQHRLSGVRQELNNYSPGLLTVQDVSRILNIHVNTVRRWSNQGVFKPVRLGPRGDRRYKLEDITNFLLSNRSGTVPRDK
jgi:hypothetical protein